MSYYKMGLAPRESYSLSTAIAEKEDTRSNAPGIASIAAVIVGIVVVAKLVKR